MQLSEEKSLSVYARVEKKTTKESRSLTVQHRGRSCDNGNTDGDVQSTSRKDALKLRSRDLYAKADVLRESQRQRKPVSDLKATNSASSERGRDEHGQQEKNKDVYLRCSPLLRFDVRRSFFEVQREMVARRGQRGTNLETVQLIN